MALQYVSGDPVLLPTIEGFGVEDDVGAVARLGAGDVALPAQLHPRHREDGPGQTDRLGSERQTQHAGGRRRVLAHQLPAVSVREGEDVMFIVLQTGHATCRTAANIQDT